RGDLVERLHVTVEADVGQHVLQVEHVVLEQVGEHRGGRVAEHGDQVVPHGTPAVGREPVSDDVDRGSLGHVGRRRCDVTGPGVVDPDLAAGDLGVVVVVDVHVGEVRQVLQRLRRGGDLA